jgi:uncharacterized protein (DUF433 family)
MSKEIFQQAVERIKATYSKLELKSGWRFLYTPASTLSPSTKLMFVGINPGGINYQAIASVEDGNAYRVEDDWSGDGKKLQKEVCQFFAKIANKLDADVNDLMDRTLTSNFCPFKSETIYQLPQFQKAVDFSCSLWKDLCDYLRPSLIICMGKLTYDNFYRILIEQGFHTENTERKPTGWGAVTYTIQEMVLDSRELIIVRIPHLSYYKTIMTREKSEQQVDELVTFIAQKLSDTETRQTGYPQMIESERFENSLTGEKFMSDTEQLRTDYWKKFHAYASKNSDIIRSLLPHTPPEAKHYMRINTGCPVAIKEAHYVCQILVRDRLIRVGLVLDKQNAPLRFKRLKDCRERIEEGFGERLRWEPAPSAEYKRNIYLEKYSDPRNQELWKEQHQWLLEKLENFYRVFSPIIVYTPQPTVVRTSRGLSIAGTRITLYTIMDYIKADWPPKLIRDWLNLTNKQINDVMDYIEAHREEVEAEYQLVLRQAEEIRQYWETRNRERFAEIAASPPQPGQEEIHAKIQARKAELGMT